MDLQATVVYLNDGTWMGWRPLLSDSNVRIATVLAVALAWPDRLTAVSTVVGLVPNERRVTSAPWKTWSSAS